MAAGRQLFTQRMKGRHEREMEGESGCRGGDAQMEKKDM